MSVGLLSLGHSPSAPDPLAGTVAAGWPSVWKYDFQTQGLSLRGGGYYQGATSGYATGKGIWAASGASYMNFPSGYVDFGHGVFLNPGDYATYLSKDNTFPPFAAIDITSEGVELKGSDQYPAVRTWLGTFVSVGGLPFISSYLTAGYAMSIGIPYARRYLFKLSNGNYDFPALWGYGRHEVGGTSGGDPQYEIDDFERFCTDNPPSFTAQSTHIAGVDAGNAVDTGASLLGGVLIETIIVHDFNFIHTYTNGILTGTIPVPPGGSTTDTHHPILNMSVGASWEAYPSGSIGFPKLTVQSVEIFALPSNTTGVFPPAPPTPKLTWASGFTGGILNSPASGTVVATLSGALTYRLIPYLNSFGGLAISGSNVVTVGTAPTGNFDFYIEGTDASGTPCLAAKLTASYVSSASIQWIQSINSANTDHCINLDIVGNTLYLCAGWTNGLGVYDITDRANPVVVTTIKDLVGDGFGHNRLNGISGVKVFGNYAFVACEQANNGSMTVVNLTTRTIAAFLNPYTAADPPTPGNEDQLAGACSIVLNAAGTIAYVSTITRQNLAIIDISTPTAPTLIKEVRAFGTSFSMAGCRDVVINESAGIAYVASEYTNNVAVIDISVSSTAHIITTTTNPSNVVQRGLTLNAAKNRLYVVGSGGGYGCLEIWDVSNPSAPALVHNFFGTVGANFYGARGIVVYSNYAYICSEFGNMFVIVDLSNELAPVVAASDGPSTNYAESLWMRVQDGYAYLAQFGSATTGGPTQHDPPGNSLTVVKINGYPTPPGSGVTSSNVLLSDGTSRLLQTDGTSKIQL